MHPRAHHIIAVALVACMIFSGIWLFWPDGETPRASPLPKDETMVEYNDTFVCNAWVADNHSQRSQGLIGTDRNENQGMLFLFDNEQYRIFHMDGMSYSIDIIFMDESREVVEVWADYEPYAPSHTSVEPVKYALEIVAGRSALLNITVGCVLNWDMQD